MGRHIFAGPARALCVPTLGTALMLGCALTASALVPDEPRRTAGFNDVVRDVVLHRGTVYVAGDFTTATDARGTHRRRHVAALDATTGRVLRWSPDANAPVTALTAVGNDVYLGGAFSSVRSAPRRRLAKVSAATGAPARGFSHTVDGPVHAMTVLDGSLFIGGSFDRVDGRVRSGLASFALRTGRLRPGWAPDATGTVRALSGTAGRVVVGGSFERLGGAADTRFLAAVGSRRGRLVTAFDPAISYPVEDLATAATRVYAAADGPGGHVRAFGNSGRDIWDLPTDGGVQAVAHAGGTVYFGGHFDNACRAARRGSPGSCQADRVVRRKLGAVTAAGRLVPWAPHPNSALGVLAIDAASRPERVAVGGAFTRLGSGRSAAHFALFR